MYYPQYKEAKQHGTPAFPAAYYHVTSAHPQYTMPYHWHTEFEIIRILSGSFDVTLDAETFTAAAGDIVLVSSATLHGGIPHDCVYECIVFQLSLIPDDSGLIRGLSDGTLCLPPRIAAGEEETLHALMHRLFHAMRHREAGYRLVTIGCLCEFFGMFVYKHTSPPLPDSNALPRAGEGCAAARSRCVVNLKAVMELIESRYGEKLTLEEMARTAGLSPKYFCRYFYRMTQRTPIDYLNYYRIERACYMMIHTDAPLTEVALSCGFNDVSYFIRTFRHYKGTTPRKYLTEPFQA